MRKATLILAFLAVVACGGAQSDSPFRCDTTGISIFNALVNGKFMPATLIYCSEDKHHLTYELRQPFMENDTQYIYRSYQFYKCDTCSTYDTCVSSYYIIPKQDKNHIAKVLKMYYVKEPDFKEDSYLSDAYHEWRSHNPKMKLERRDLDDMPRHWFRIEKYQGRYALTIDYNYGMAFTDSMIVFYYMETWFSQYGEVKKTNSDVYYYEDYDYSHDIEGWAKRKNWLHPSVLVKGLYLLSSLSADGILDHSLVTPQENLKYFDLINAYMCDLQYLDYDTVDYEAHTDPALMADIRNLQQSLKEQASKGKRKTDTEEHPVEPIVVEGVELFPADGNTPVKSFSDTVSGEPPVMYAEEMPEFPGGPDSLNVFLRRNTQWPHPLYDATGTVLIEFVVEVDGSITNPTIKVSLSPELDAEALRLVGLMPKWKPARAQGEPVRCYYTIPVRFTEEGEIESKSSLLEENIDMSQTVDANEHDDYDGAIVDWFCEPEYEGGQDSIKAFIERNLRIPPGYEDSTGVVLVEFVVETDGTVTNPRVKVSLNPVLDAEAVKVVMSLPNKWIWDPERCYGAEVKRCFYNIPVSFSR